MNKKTYSQILDEVAHDQVPETLNLAPHILSRIQKGKGTTMQPRMKAVLAAILVLLVLSAVSIGVPAVRATIQRWFGYVPGFGFVQNKDIRTLAAPVSVEQDGMILTVDEAISSTDKTVLRYTLNGISPDELVPDYLCLGGAGNPTLVLPAGTHLDAGGVRTENPRGEGADAFHFEATFPALPADENSATLVISCIPWTDPAAVPQHWEVAFLFGPANPDVAIAPVFAVPTSSAQPAPQGNLVITKIIPAQEGYILAGTLTVVLPKGVTLDEWDGFLEDAAVTDANGRDVTYDYAPSGFLPEELTTDLGPDTLGWTAQINGRDLQWPLTMTVYSITGATAPYPPARFQFDAGPDPQVGQVWTLDQDVTLGPTTVHVISVERIEQDFGLEGYEFTFVYNPLVNFSVEIDGRQAMGGGGSSTDSAGTYTLARSYPDGIPAGLLTIILNGYGQLRLQGPWQVTWDAPAGEVLPSATP